MLGTSGSAGDRALLVTASPRSLPSLICGTAGGSELNAIGVCPRERRRDRLTRAVERHVHKVEPERQAEARRSDAAACRCRAMRSCTCSGLALISATSSFTLWAGSEGWTESTCRRAHRHRDRLEVLVGIVGHGVVHRRIDDDVRRHDEQRCNRRQPLSRPGRCRYCRRHRRRSRHRTAFRAARKLLRQRAARRYR